MNKIYYQLKLKQLSPLRIGNGDSKITDSDLMTDLRGFPFIPGSSLAGVLREKMDQNKADGIFGYINGLELKESVVLVSDAVLPNDTTSEDVSVYKRDGVGLSDWGTAIKGSKYDFQVVETKKEYISVVEYTSSDEDTEKELDILMAKIIGEGLQLGARTTRGYGRFDVAVYKKSFVFPDDLEEWISFDAFDENAFSNSDRLEASDTNDELTSVVIEFEFKGSFNVRVKTTNYEILEDGTKPDSVPMKNFEDMPVIPGTSWAGVFRHHMRDIIRDCHFKHEKEENSLRDLDKIFGKTEDGEHRRSDIAFSETKVEGGHAITVTRNAVDRFTQAPKNTGLFTTQCWSGGKGELEITYKHNCMTEFQRQLLAACIVDMGLGLMPVGGEKGVGRGEAAFIDVCVNGESVLKSVADMQTDFLEVG